MTGSRSTGKLSIATALLPAGKDKALRIQIRFTDSGPGIPPDVMPRIFEPFFTTKDVKDGMGLGLAICEQIMERHGGCIQAENNPGGGASFSLELPVIGQRSIHRSPSPDQRRSRHTERATHSSTSTKHHVLIVDDEPSVLESLKQALEGAGYQVTAVADARQALAMLDRNRVDLIISDVTMSQMSGQQFWQALKDHHPQLARRTIFATGDSSSQERRALLQDWGCAYIEKPFRLDEVLCLIRSTLLDE
jgi:CheY-like chemotaxis protein